MQLPSLPATTAFFPSGSTEKAFNEPPSSPIPIPIPILIAFKLPPDELLPSLGGIIELTPGALPGPLLEVIGELGEVIWNRKESDMNYKGGFRKAD